MKKFITASALFMGMVLGIVLTIVVYLFWYQSVQLDENMADSEKKPLYWVAPMDPNYRRDKPGKSPMGMDLIPVYEEGSGMEDLSPGTVRISPDVINNLGVRTAEVERHTLHAEIKTVGYVRYDEDHLIHIHPRVKGWIEKLYVKTSGDPVEKGQPLYRIYSPELVNAQEELVLALRRKNQRLIEASEERLKALYVPTGVIKRIKKKLKVSQTMTFYAPQSGVVDNLGIREGFYVQPGTTLMSIGVLDPIWVEAEVFERQAPLVLPGLPVTMTTDFIPGKRWQGKVDYIYPTLDPKTRTLKVRLRFSNGDRELKPNMFTRVVIHAQSSSEVLVVPKEAVIRTGDTERVVLVLGDGRFKSINVRTGRFDDRYAEILEGLSEGETVVVSAQFLIDSESSKTSDFRRMNHGDSMNSMSEESSDGHGVSAIEGIIHKIIPEENKIEIWHGAIPDWNKPPMLMKFEVAKDVDISNLRESMKVDFTFQNEGGKLILTRISKKPGPEHDMEGDQE